MKVANEILDVIFSNGRVLVTETNVSDKASLVAEVEFEAAERGIVRDSEEMREIVEYCLAHTE